FIYNNNIQIVQTRDYVMILTEMIHDARVIALNRHTHLPAAIRQWKGDSIGRWEGDTLVVDTLAYQFTIDDPASFFRPWSAESAMAKTAGPIFEYACHEGNYSMTNALR